MFKLLLPILIGLGITQFSMVSDILVWDRYLIEHGELWRIVTGNFTHTNLAHLIMNAAALVLFSYIFKELLTLKKIIDFTVFYQFTNWTSTTLYANTSLCWTLRRITRAVCLGCHRRHKKINVKPDGYYC